MRINEKNQKKEGNMKIELTPLEYELLKLFQQLTVEEKTIVLSAGQALSSGQATSAFPALKAV